MQHGNWIVSVHLNFRPHGCSGKDPYDYSCVRTINVVEPDRGFNAWIRTEDVDKLKESPELWIKKQALKDKSDEDIAYADCWHCNPKKFKSIGKIV